MTKNITSWKPGESGNPKGRPPGKRSLTKLLEAASNEVVVVGGQAMTANEMIGRMVVQFMLTGEVMLNGSCLRASVSEWLAMVRWFYAHVDGAAPKGGELAEAPELVVRVVRVNEAGEEAPLLEAGEYDDGWGAEGV